jgi:hypothetical protein
MALKVALSEEDASKNMFWMAVWLILSFLPEVVSSRDGENVALVSKVGTIGFATVALSEGKKVLERIVPHADASVKICHRMRHGNKQCVIVKFGNGI